MFQFTYKNYYLNFKNLRKNVFLLKFKTPSFYNRHKNKKILILGTGPSIFKEKTKIVDYIKKNNPIVIACNNIPNEFKIDYRIFTNRSRFANYSYLLKDSQQLIITPYIKKKLINQFVNKRDHFYIYHKVDKKMSQNFKIENGIIILKENINVGFMSILCAYIMGSDNIKIAGIDGYSRFTTQHYYEEKSDPHDINTLIQKDNYLSLLFDDIKFFFSSKKVSFDSLTKSKYNIKNIR